MCTPRWTKPPTDKRLHRMMCAGVALATHTRQLRPMLASTKNRRSLHEEAQNARRRLQKRLDGAALPRMDRQAVLSELSTLRRVQRQAAEDMSWSTSQMLRGQLSDAATHARSILDA